jgi:hypothetical protein
VTRERRAVLALVASRASKVRSEALEPVAPVALVVVVLLVPKVPKALRVPRVTRAPQVLGLVGPQVRWVARASVASLGRMGPRAILVHQAHRVQVVTMGSRVIVVILGQWVALGCVARPVTRAFLDSRAIMGTQEPRATRVMLACGVPRASLARWASRVRTELMALGAQSEEVAAVALRVSLGGQDLKAFWAAMASRAPVACEAPQGSRERRERRVSVALVATRE